MDLLAGVLPNFWDIVQITGIFFLRGGWIFLVFTVIYILYKLYRGEIENQYLAGITWVFLNIKVPRENMVSLLAVENIFAQMHALHTSLSLAQMYVEGKTQLWYSLEIVSMGGKISFLVRTPKQMKDVVEAAVYAQFPTAEISETEDYMGHFDYDPERTPELEIWGTEWKLTDSFTIPLKTYRDFEHPVAEDKILDPLAPFFESLSKIEPHEFYGVQFIIQPLGDDEWKPSGEAKVKELTGEEMPSKTKLVDILLAPLNWFASFKFTDLFSGGGGGGSDEKKQKNNWQNMTDAEKERVALVERKISKPGYKTKIRHIYIAPKAKFSGAKKAMVIGSYRFLGSAMTNKLKPDVSNTWTTVEYKFSPSLEGPYLEWEMNKRKRYLFKGFKERSTQLGSPMFVLNVEELATLFHFPITTETKPMITAVEKTESKKTQPPANLPIAAAD